ncbi:MAG TPA: choice-of-anchor D domain-containing protein, partial [Candidatus Angelobacter sp.]|nr:choice-of-anchor D domain-containing protein [Candidatus Angelobacter sp.]
MKKLFYLLVLCAVFCASALAQAQSPRIIFSDLQSGPNTGGVNGKGAMVTVHGFGFGASRGASSVTIGGAPADNYPLWSDTKISFQLGAAAVSGNIQVNVGSAASNGVSFTVRPGNLYFVSPSGNDANAGTATAPWHSAVKAKNAAVAGDIIYLMDGVNQSSLESASASLVLAKSGSASLPIALVAYPGATATIGSATGQQYGIRTTSASNYWVLAGLTLRGSFSALSVANSSTWRVIGNDVSCPNGSGSGACVDFSTVNNMSMYRNRVHDVGSTTSTSLKLYQGVLFDAGSNAIDFGWNEIANVRSCRALQFSSDTSKLYNITVDNNLIHDSRCDGINFATVDPALGAVRAFNNVIYRTGTGPAPGGIESNYACINVGAAGNAAVLVQNNTLYDCGRRENGDSGAISASAAVTVVNNIIVATAGEQYLAPNSLITRFTGNNNLFFGAGAAPAFSSASINADPKFVDPANANFQLLSGSPAIDHGANTGVTRDALQAPRPSGAGYDMGAYEFIATVAPPPPPQQGTLTVSAQSLAFGSVNTGTSASQSLTVSNTSSVAITISNLSATGAGFSQSGVTLPLTLASGQSTAIAVKFAPAAAGSVTGSLQITSNATNASIAIALSGTGTTPPPQQGTLTVNSQSLAFGSVNTGTSASQNLTVSNTSSVAVTISNLSATGAGFSQSGVTLPLTLASGQSTAIAVKFAPTAAGSVTGSLQITSNATNASIAIALSGTGTTPPPQQGTLTVSAQSLAFGSVNTGTSASQSLTVSNT